MLFAWLVLDSQIRAPLYDGDRQITVHDNELQLNQHLKGIFIFLL